MKEGGEEREGSQGHCRQSSKGWDALDSGLFSSRATSVLLCARAAVLKKEKPKIQKEKRQAIYTYTQREKKSA